MRASSREQQHKLGQNMLQFVTEVSQHSSPGEILDSLDKVTSSGCNIHVLVAALLPIRWGDWRGVERGKTVFVHKSVPAGWWEEWLDLSKAHPGPGMSMARSSLAPFTNTQLMSTLEPLGLDRWPFELALKHGIRDWFSCPIGGRWLVAYWSHIPLGKRLTDEMRAILFMGATFAAIRLQQIITPHIGRIGKPSVLTPRELSVLKLFSLGYQMAECAEYLALSPETVRTHLKKAQEKLGVRNRTHAVSQAIRLQLIY